MKRAIFWQWAGSAAAVLLCVGSLMAKPGVIKTNNGQTYDGEITEQGDEYIVTVKKIDNRIPKSDVASVTYHGSVDDQYKEKIAALDPKDANGRVTVAQWAFDNGRNDLAIEACTAALQLDSNNAGALQMLKTVRAQQAMSAQQHTATPTTPTTPHASANPHAAATSAPAPVERKLLTAAEINSIRQHEIRAGETVPMQISADVKKSFPAKINMKPSEFGNKTATEQLKLILDQGDADARAGVKIMRDPLAITEFKRSVLPMVQRNCATSGCHGGSAGGKLILFTGTDDATAYTDFYILTQYHQKAPGQGTGFFAGGGEQKLIERGGADKSLLIQYALPPSVADNPHPEVPNSGYMGVFHNKTERPYTDVAEWINNLVVPDPTYDVKYVPPMGKVMPPTTAPAK